MPYEIEFYEDSAGRKPCLEWIRELEPRKRWALGTAMREILQQQGINVCGTPFGKQLGEGLFEFRLREEGLLLRVFCRGDDNDRPGRGLVASTQAASARSGCLAVQARESAAGPAAQESVTLTTKIHRASTVNGA